MKTHLYRLICADDKGWHASSGLWADGYETEDQRIFATRDEALAAKREHDDCDYAATMAPPEPGDEDYDEYTDNYDQWRERHQPVFAIERVPAVEAAYFAWLRDDTEVFDRVIELSGAPAPAGYVPGETEELPPREVIEEWIASLPKRALRAVMPPSPADKTVDSLWRESARLAGASSLTHSFALLGAYYEQQTNLLREAAERGLAR